MPSLDQLASLAEVLGVTQANLLRRAGHLPLPGFEELLSDPDVDRALTSIVEMATPEQKRQLVILWATLELAAGYVGRAS